MTSTRDSPTQDPPETGSDVELVARYIPGVPALPSRREAPKATVIHLPDPSPTTASSAVAVPRSDADARVQSTGRTGAAGAQPGLERRRADADRFLAQVFNEYKDAQSPLWRYAVRRPRLTFRTMRSIRLLTPLQVSVPPGPDTAAILATLRQYAVSRRTMLGVASVLQTPVSPGTFAEGPDRGTLRRKMRAAVKQGVTIRPVADPDREALLALAKRHERENHREEYRNASPDIDDLLQYDLWLAAYDAADEPIALTVIPCGGEWAVLRYFRTLVPGNASSDARYAMTEALAEALAARGVRYLVDTARPHWLPNGLRHFQRMVGFRLVRIRSIRGPRG